MQKKYQIIIVLLIIVIGYCFYSSVVYGKSICLYQGKPAMVVDQRQIDGGVTVRNFFGKHIGYYDSRVWGGEHVDSINKNALHCIDRKF